MEQQFAYIDSHPALISTTLYLQAWLNFLKDWLANSVTLFR